MAQRAQSGLPAKGIELFTTVPGLGYETDKWVSITPDPLPDSRTMLVDGFAEAILEDKEPFITGEQGVMITELMLGAYKSMEMNTPYRMKTAI